MSHVRGFRIAVGAAVLAAGLFWGCGPQAHGENGSKEVEAALYPEIEPFETGYLKVDDTHEIYYELCGNPEGKPVMTLHGGPGFGSYPRLRRYFDPEKFLIVLHDQRGAGRSRPQGELKGNTTPNLVEDVERLRKHLDLGKVLVFGGSWGTTLGLAYAEKYPDNVTGIVLRGVFLGTKKEVDHHYFGARHFFPEEQQRLVSVLPDPERGPDPAYLFELIRNSGEKDRNRYMDALGRFELKMGKMHVPQAEIDGILAEFPKEAAYRIYSIDLLYASNGYFLEEGQLLRDAEKIAHIPAVIINGRWDVVCPPEAAYEIHRRMPKSLLVIVEEAGHLESEPGVTKALVEAVKRFE